MSAEPCVTVAQRLAREAWSCPLRGSKSLSGQPRKPEGPSSTNAKAVIWGDA